MRVDRRYLAAVTAPLLDPGTGAVTCLYQGVATAGKWAELGALHINFGFLPSVLAAEALGINRGCFGATIAMRRETLSRDRRVYRGARRARRRPADRRGSARAGARRRAVALSRRGSRVGAVACRAVAPRIAVGAHHTHDCPGRLRRLGPDARRGDLGSRRRGHRIWLDRVRVSGDFRAAEMGLGAGDRGCARLSRRQALAAPAARRLVLCRVRRQFFRTKGLLAGSALPSRAEWPHVSRSETRPNDEDPLPAPALLRRLRRRRRLALSGKAGDPLLLVPDLARPAGGTRRRQQVDRCAAGAAQARQMCCRWRGFRARGAAYLDAVLRLRHPGRRGAEGRRTRG